jgi:hypothetical protein
VLHRVFHAAEIVVIDDISGDPDNKQVPQTFIENELGRDARVRAAQNYGEWVLPILQLFATGQCFVRVLLLVRYVTPVALHKLGKGLIGWHKICWLLAPGGHRGQTHQKITAMLRRCLYDPVPRQRLFLEEEMPVRAKAASFFMTLPRIGYRPAIHEA